MRRSFSAVWWPPGEWRVLESHQRKTRGGVKLWTTLAAGPFDTQQEAQEWIDTNSRSA